MILDFISKIFKPAADLVDNLTTSDEERLQLRNKLAEIKAEVLLKTLEYEKNLLNSQADIIQVEAGGLSVLQRIWRPLTMLTFLGLVVLDGLDLLPNPLAPQAWDLLKIGLGGYVVGRSAEKLATTIKSPQK